MLETDVSKARRSTGFLCVVRVVVAGKNSDGRRFRKPANRGDQRAARADVSQSAAEYDAVLASPTHSRRKEQECRIVFLGDARIKASGIGLEFPRLRRIFWGVDFVSIGPRRLPDGRLSNSALRISGIHAHSASSFSIVVSLISDLVLTIVDTGYKNAQFPVRDALYFTERSHRPLSSYSYKFRA